MDDRTIIRWNKMILMNGYLKGVDILAAWVCCRLFTDADLIKKHHNRDLSLADIHRMTHEPTR